MQAEIDPATHGIYYEAVTFLGADQTRLDAWLVPVPQPLQLQPTPFLVFGDGVRATPCHSKVFVTHPIALMGKVAVLNRATAAARVSDLNGG